MQGVDGRLLSILFLGTGSLKASSVAYYKLSSLELSASFSWPESLQL